MRVPARLWRFGLVLVGLGFIAFLGLSGGLDGSEGGGVGGGSVTEQHFADLRLGAARDDVEDRLGAGEDALEFIFTGAAVEPIDAECVYYHPQAGLEILQLCYRDDRLVSKRLYEE